MPALFITGTDTDVGKTIVSRALLQVLQRTLRKFFVTMECLET